MKGKGEEKIKENKQVNRGKKEAQGRGKDREESGQVGKGKVEKEISGEGDKYRKEIGREEEGWEGKGMVET